VLHHTSVRLLRAHWELAKPVEAIFSCSPLSSLREICDFQLVRWLVSGLISPSDAGLL